jgi:hypothetical protein
VFEAAGGPEAVFRVVRFAMVFTYLFNATSSVEHDPSQNHSYLAKTTPVSAAVANKSPTST